MPSLRQHQEHVLHEYTQVSTFFRHRRSVNSKKANAAHPTYQAMIELGRVQKAIFCAGTCAAVNCNARSTAA